MRRRHRLLCLCRVPERPGTDGASAPDGGRLLRNSRICESSLPYSVRLRTDKNVAEYNRLLLRKNQVQSRVAAQENGSYLVELRLQDDVDSILHLELTAATEAMARDLADRFRKDPEGIYTRLLSALYPPAE